MLFLIYLITSLVLVTCDDLVGVTYYFEDNYLDVFSDRQCVNATKWSLVNYGYLDLRSPYEDSKGILSLRNSCTASFPIVFHSGILEVTVYLRTVSKYSGITISVFDKDDEIVSTVRYQRSNKNFIPGWVIVSVPIEKQTTGYVQISGQSLPTELVVVDSLKYMPGNETYSQSEVKTQEVVNEEPKTTPSTVQFIQETIYSEEFFLEFEDGSSGDGDEDSDEFDSSGDYSIEDPNTDDPNTENNTEDTNTEDPNTESNTEDPNTENPNTETNTEDPNTEDPSTESNTEDPNTENPNTENNTEDSNTEDPNTEDPNTESNTENPGTEDPNTENPSTEDPNTENPSTENPNTENPSTEDPNTENPSTEDPNTENPSTEDPNTENPSTEDPITENPSTEDPNTENPSTEDPNTENPSTEDPNTENPSTEDPNTENNTEDPETENSTEDPIPEEDTANSDDGFWNPFTITFVSVGAFTAVGVVGVGSYYLGKSRGVSQTSPLDPFDLESNEAPSIIPRARSVFSDNTYRYDRFSR